MPPSSNELLERLASSVLAAELTNRYPKERILEWFLNSADYGRSAFGLDAAALTYFAKSADELSLSEAALLAALAQDPTLDPLSQSTRARTMRQVVLQAMQRAAFIEADEAERAARLPLGVLEDQEPWHPPEHVLVVLSQLERLLGRERMGRSGLIVTSTLDNDLQEQSGCVAESHLARLAGQPIDALVSTASDGPCVAASLLPTLRPGDAGMDHRIEDWGLIVLDPVRGEVLAAHGRTDLNRVAGPLFDPFIYLTAFAQGSTPATMVLDLRDDLAESRGPVRMRTALANLYPGASQQALSSVGQQSFVLTLDQMGIASPNTQSVSLADIAAAYGIIAADGLRIGFESSEVEILPSIVLKVEGAEGEPLYGYAPANQAILSPQLAYLMVDVLSDESARWNTLGPGNPLEIGMPACVVSAQDLAGESNWTVGITPHRAVAVWVGGTEMRGVDRLNGSAPIWHAVTRFGAADFGTAGWEQPPGLTEREVCDPSGLLPTLYCPELVTEIFVQGTEPTHFDTLFRPLRINSETGKLATLFTPLEAVEERVYFVPPQEAQAWAEQAGIEQISSPAPFEIVGREIQILGEAAPEGFGYYRLQYGQGLNPSDWVQIGQDQSRQIRHARLGSWSTEGLSGLYTLQLLVILTDGQVRTAALPLTIDNQPPLAQLVSPQDGAVLRRASTPSALFQADALDNVGLDRIEFWVDGRRIGVATQAPYTIRWLTPAQAGEYRVEVRAYDRAGNRTTTEAVLIEVKP
jgi:membrane carboxypeptidase/penicillin-binding protein PbpC